MPPGEGMAPRTLLLREAVQVLLWGWAGGRGGGAERGGMALGGVPTEGRGRDDLEASVTSEGSSGGQPTETAAKGRTQRPPAACPSTFTWSGNPLPPPLSLATHTKLPHSTILHSFVHHLASKHWGSMWLYTF